MKIILQRVKKANVKVNDELISSIEHGLLLLLGICSDDTEAEADTLCNKVVNMRIFEDDNGKMNKSLVQEDGEILLVPNFTLCADVRKGNRPSFIGAMSPEKAKKMYLYFGDKLNKLGVKSVQYGIFGADMEVSLINDGPVTVIIDSDSFK